MTVQNERESKTLGGSDTLHGRSRFGQVEGAVWRPSADDLERSKLAKAIERWGFEDLADFHRASVENPEWFWPAAAEDLGVDFQGKLVQVCNEDKGKPFPSWFEGQTFNVVWSCIERHAAKAHTANKPALVYEGDFGQHRAVSYAELKREVDLIASALCGLGVGKGDRVALFTPPIPEAVAVAFGCAKIGAIMVPAFSGYGSDALASRIQASQATVLVTVDGTTRRGKTVPMKAIADGAAAVCPSLRHMLVVRSSGESVNLQEGRDHWWEALPSLGVGEVETEALDPNDPLFILYTSGTTGSPKGIVHSHVGFQLKAAVDLGYAFDIQEDDIVAWTADMGWMLAPLLMLGALHLGATLVLVEGVPDYPEEDRLWHIVERNQATLLGIAATAARGLRTKLAGGRPDVDLSTLRAFASTGEAWDAPTWHWLFETVGQSRLPILNYSGGTEIGGGILSGYTIAPHAPAAFCGPLPGLDVDVFDPEGHVTGDIGELVVLNTWPGMAHSFWNDDQRFLDTYWSRWENIWVHGDLASVDKDGYWHIHGRSDDTLKIGGRRIGPAEIESALVSQAGVAEAGVIGVPDEMKGHIGVAFVVAAPGVSLSEGELTRAMVTAVGKGMTPSRIHIVASLPKTKNGKIIRRAIRARYLGEPVGDMSSLDPQTPLENIPLKGE